MPDVFEIPESGEGDSPENGSNGSNKKRYKVLGEPSSATAVALVRALSPLAVVVGLDTLVRQNVTFDPFPIDNWELTVNYGSEADPESQQRPEPGFVKVRFRTSGGTETVKFAPLVSRHWNSATGEAPFMEAINFDGKDVKGIEIPRGELTFDVTVYYDPREITTQFLRELNDLTGSINTDAFFGFEPGEVRFEGTDGEVDVPTVAGQRVQPVALTHHYTFSPADDAIEIDGIDTGFNEVTGSATSTIAKRGWDYLHVRDLKTKDSSTNVVIPKPKHVYVSAPHYEMAFVEFFKFGGST